MASWLRWFGRGGIVTQEQRDLEAQARHRALWAGALVNARQWLLDAKQDLEAARRLVGVSEDRRQSEYARKLEHRASLEHDKALHNWAACYAAARMTENAE